jgi:serine/threonine protein kinase
MKGFRAINDMKVLHRDLKLANILVHFKEADMDMVLSGGLMFQNYKKQASLIGKVDVIIADLGFAKQMNEENDLTRTMCGTPLYMAPEIL